MYREHSIHILYFIIITYIQWECAWLIGPRATDVDLVWMNDDRSYVIPALEILQSSHHH